MPSKKTKIKRKGQPLGIRSEPSRAKEAAEGTEDLSSMQETTNKESEAAAVGAAPASEEAGLSPPSENQGTGEDRHSEPRLKHAHSVDLDVFAEEKQAPETPPSPRTPRNEVLTEPKLQTPLQDAAQTDPPSPEKEAEPKHSETKGSQEKNGAEQEVLQKGAEKKEGVEKETEKREAEEEEGGALKEPEEKEPEDKKDALKEPEEKEDALKEPEEKEDALKEPEEKEDALKEPEEKELEEKEGEAVKSTPSLFVTHVGVDPKKAVAKALRALGLTAGAASSPSASDSSSSDSSSQSASDEESEAEEDPVLQSLTPLQKAQLLRLQENAEEVARLEAESELRVQRERFELSRRLQPVFAERAALLAKTPTVSGDTASAVAAATAAGLSADAAASDALREEAFLQTVGTPAIPGFWTRVLERVKATKLLVAENDRAALMYLADITLETRPLKKEGFAVEFLFKPNPFFSNERLRKDFFMTDADGQVVLKSTTGTTIQWAEGMDLTKTVSIRKQRNVRTGQVRVLQEIIPTASFFNFFENSEVPAERAMKLMSNWEVKEVTERLRKEFNAAIALRDVVVPRAVEVFMGLYEGEQEDASSSSEEEGN